MPFGGQLASNLAPKTRQDAPGAAQEATKIEEKWSSVAKTLPRSIWMRFWMDFGWILEPIWEDFRRIFGSIWSQNAHKTKNDGFKMVGRAQRASAASDVSGALEKQAKRPPNTKKKLQNTRKHKAKQQNASEQNEIRNKRTALPVPCRVRFMLEAFSGQDAPKTAPRRPQDGPRRTQDAPRRLQDDPKTHPGRPRRPQDEFLEPSWRSR